MPFPRTKRFSFTLPGTGGEVAGLDFGHARGAPQAVFLHANGFCASAYRSMLEPLGETHRVLAVDQRGHGRTTLPAQPRGRPDWLDLRDDLLSMLDALKLGPVVLSGHSMGGTVAVLAAAARPDRVKALVLFDPVLLPREMVTQLRRAAPAGDESWPDLPLVQGALKRRAVFESRVQAAKGLAGRGAFKSWPEAAVADYLVDGVLERPEGGVGLACAPAWEASNYCAQGHDGWAALKSLTCPVSILRAESGSTCDGDTVEVMALECPNLSVAVVPGTSHFIPQERPELARAALADSLPVH